MSTRPETKIGMALFYKLRPVWLNLPVSSVETLVMFEVVDISSGVSVVVATAVVDAAAVVNRRKTCQKGCSGGST